MKSLLTIIRKAVTATVCTVALLVLCSGSEPAQLNDSMFALQLAALALVALAAKRHNDRENIKKSESC